MVLETHIKLCVSGPDFYVKFFSHKNWEIRPKISQNKVFLNLLKILVINL